MKISTFNRELDVYPELILSFNGNSYKNYTTGGFFEVPTDILSPLEIVVNTKRDELGNYMLSSVLFRNDIDDFFYELDIEKINMTMDGDNLIFTFNNLNTQVYSLELGKELHDLLSGRIYIEYALIKEKKIIKSLRVNNYKNIIDQDSLKFTEYEVTNA